MRKDLLIEQKKGEEFITVNGIKYFPEINEEIKLETAKWYKKGELLCLIKCVDKPNRYFQRFHCFGFNTPTGYDNFCFDVNIGELHNFTEAKNEDIKLFVEKEISKKGYEEGVWISWNDEGIGQIKGKNYWAENCLAVPCDEKTTTRMNNNFPLFHEGQWAKIIPTKTKQEAEKELNCKIIN